MAKKNTNAPWKKLPPEKSRHTKLTPKSKEKAKKTARKTGRKYPNLVDNMNAAKNQRRAKSKT